MEEGRRRARFTNTKLQHTLLARFFPSLVVSSWVLSGII